MKTRLLFCLGFMIVSIQLYSQDTARASDIKLSIEVQSLNYVGNFSGVDVEYNINNKISLGAAVRYLHNRAFIPRHTFIKTEHRFYAYRLSERLSFGVHAGYNINNAFFRFGEIQAFAALNYMNTTYRNTWMRFNRLDTVNRDVIFDVVNIRNSNIHCMDLIGGINVKSKIAGKLFLNSSAGIGMIYLTGFNKNDIGKTSLLKLNYLLSVGLGYGFSRK